jgi:hypothetical protein
MYQNPPPQVFLSSVLGIPLLEFTRRTQPRLCRELARMMLHGTLVVRVRRWKAEVMTVFL